jgi:hypothetical protein
VLRIRNLLETRLLHTKLRDLAAGRRPAEQRSEAANA